MSLCDKEETKSCGVSSHIGVRQNSGGHRDRIRRGGKRSRSLLSLFAFQEKQVEAFSMAGKEEKIDRREKRKKPVGSSIQF